MSRASTGRSGPGDRRPDESDQAWASFVVYRDQPPEHRSTRQVAKETGRSYKQISAWSARHQWVRRTAEWDAAQDRLFREDMQRERRAMARRHARIAGAVLGKVVEKLQTLNPEKLTAGQLAQLFDVATRVERQALGEPDRLEHSGPDGGPIPIEIETNDELELAAELRIIGHILFDRLGETEPGQPCPMCRQTVNTA